MNAKGKSYLLFISVLSVFAFGNCMGAVDGALSKIADAMDVEHTIALYVGSIPALTCMISSLFLGFVAGKKLPYKITVVFCAVLMIVAGTIPFLAQNFATILVTRGFFGLGLGGIMSLENPIATKLIPVQSRASILGVGTCIAFTFQCILQLVGGILADVEWNFVFFTHLILIIPLIVMVIFLPKMELDPPEKTESASTKIPLTAIVMCIVIGIILMNLAPLLFGSAFYVAALSDSATVASIIAMLFSVGCMVGGLIYPTLYKWLKGKCFTVFLVIGAIGLVISASATSIIVLAIGFLVGGISYASTQAAMMMLLGLICPPERVAFASALMMVFVNLGAFLCSSWEMLIGLITGDALYAPLYIGAGIFVILAVILFIKSPFPKESPED